MRELYNRKTTIRGLSVTYAGRFKSLGNEGASHAKRDMVGLTLLVMPDNNCQEGVATWGNASPAVFY